MQAGDLSPVILNVSDGVMALLFIAMASGAFWLAEWFEKRSKKVEY